jgi:crotonobetainyl-CoA:carnitine CoA-transferase CaiB-like acyl-CoA transferase
MSGPLSGIRVVDFSRVLAGPLCARTLLDLGAEVIKIEPPRPDVSRFAFPSTPGMSGYYAQQNAGKRNVSIDLNVPGARALALRLCDTADVVVENFRAGTLGFFGLDYKTLAARNPRLIYASITGYGQGGPWQGRMAYAPTVQAEAGFTANSIRHYGEVLGEPRTDSLSHADVYAGLQAAVAILAALHRRATTGTGQYIDVAMAATLMAVNERAHVDLNDADLGDEPAILGATDCPFFTGPGGEHFTVATSLVGSRTFPSYLRAMRRADLADDPRFATAAARRGHFAELHHIVQTWILTFHDIGALDAQLDEAKIALGEVRSLKKLSEMEWAEYWGAVQEVSDRNGGTYRLPGRPWHFSREQLAPLGDPAFQGEHNRNVFGELCLSEVQIDGYIASGALVSVPIPAPVRDDAGGAEPMAKVNRAPLVTTTS